MSNNELPLVSVVMSVHNACITELKNSCHSILRQTYPNIEFIIIDDINSRTILDFLSELEKKHENVFILKNAKNCGLTRSLIKGIQHSKGEYIARQDADDLSDYNRIEEQVAHFQKNSLLCLLGTAYVLENQVLVSKKFQSHELQHTSLIESMFSINPFCHTSVMFRKTHYFLAGGYDARYKTSQDFDLWFRLAKVGIVENLPNALVTRRLTRTSLSSNTFRALEQIQNGLTIRLREKALYTGRFFYLFIISSYLRSLFICILFQLLTKIKLPRPK